MKKIILTIFLVIFTCLNTESAQAIVFHNMNSPSNMYYRNRYAYRHPYNYGYNVPYKYRRLPAHPRYYYTPRYPAMPRYARRYYNPYRMGYYNPYYGYPIPYARRRYYVNNSSNVARREPLSRFDKNYIVPSNYNKRVTCGGVTYYGGMNPCK